ncbi:MAG: SDR family NAD(P)-dependent oxidoreductase [Rikenellaceae bacterium]
MKSIIIVGASSGIGAELARQFIGLGWRVGIASRRTEPLMQIAKLAPDRVFTAQIDVCDEDAPQHFKSLIDKMGGIDVYLHSTGIGHQNKELTPQIEIDTLRTNGEGFVRMITAAFNYFRERGEGGHIAAITSVAGTRGGGNAPAYSATKAMQSTYLQGLAQLSNTEGLKISITDILPGFVATPLIGDCPYPMVMGVEPVSRKIVRAILSRRRRVVIDWRYAMLIAVWKLIPRCVWERMKL